MFTIHYHEYNVLYEERTITSYWPWLEIVGRNDCWLTGCAAGTTTARWSTSVRTAAASSDSVRTGAGRCSGSVLKSKPRNIAESRHVACRLYSDQSRKSPLIFLHPDWSLSPSSFFWLEDRHKYYNIFAPKNRSVASNIYKKWQKLGFHYRSAVLTDGRALLLTQNWLIIYSFADSNTAMCSLHHFLHTDWWLTNPADPCSKQPGWGQLHLRSSGTADIVTHPDL